MAIGVLVTEAAGALGQRIVHSLRVDGYDVLACGREPGPNVDSYWDVGQSDAPNVDYRPKVVVHAAARVGSFKQAISDADSLIRVNVLGTLRVAHWCVDNDVEHLVLVSGAIVYGEWTDSPKAESAPLNPWLAGPYAVSKLGSEQVAHMVEAAGVSLTVLRLSSLYGIGYSRGLIQRLIREGKRKGSISLSPPFDDAFDLLNLGDAARTVRHAVADRSSGTWNVGGGSLTTIEDLAMMCAASSESKVKISQATDVRSRRILNWVDDAAARTSLHHCNKVEMQSGIEEIAASIEQEC